MKLVKTSAAALSILACFSILTSCDGTSAISSGGNLDGIVANKSLVIGTEAGYAPFEFIGCSTKALGLCFKSEIQGLDVEIAKLVGKQISEEYGTTINVSFKNMDFDGLIGALQSEQIDLVAAAFSSTPDRDEVVDFSNVYYSAKTVLVVPTDSSITSISDLQGLTIGAQLGTVQDGMIADLVGTNGTAKSLADLSTLVLDTLAGNSDGILVEEAVAQNIIKSNSGLKIIDSIQFADDDGYVLAAHTGRQPLLDVANRVIQKITSDGTLLDLYTKAVDDAARSF